MTMPSLAKLTGLSNVWCLQPGMWRTRAGFCLLRSGDWTCL